MDDVQVNSMVYVKQPCRRIVGEIVIKLLDPKRSEAVHLRAASSWRVKRRKRLPWVRQAAHDQSGNQPTSMIIPAPTVALVASSIRIIPPVIRFRA